MRCCCLVTQLCHTLCDPIDYSSSVHEILQARILKWLPFPSSEDLPDPGTETVSSVAPVLQMDSLPLSDQGNPIRMNSVFNNTNWWEFQKEMVFRNSNFWKQPCGKWWGHFYPCVLPIGYITEAPGNPKLTCHLLHMCSGSVPLPA